MEFDTTGTGHSMAGHWEAFRDLDLKHTEVEDTLQRSVEKGPMAAVE